MLKSIDGVMLSKMIMSAANNLSNHKKLVNDLNVFPVPDGDTGTNMSMTMNAGMVEVQKNYSDKISTVADSLASALLRGARGNSGVILSQIFRGFSKALKDLKSVDAIGLALAFKEAADAAYRAVMKPTEGTILTIARAAGDAALEFDKKNEDVLQLFSFVIEKCEIMLDKTPDMLPILKQVGVVDAGGKGFLIILEGMKFALKNDDVIQLLEKDEKQIEAVQSHFEVEQDITFTYCTEFIIQKDNVDAKLTKLERVLKLQGDSTVLVDDGEVVKVHIHTDNPGKVIQEALTFGELINIKIDNMRYQHNNIISQAKVEDKSGYKQYGVVTVAAGDGVRDIFVDLGADFVVSGGQSMNPSTEDILSAVSKVKAHNVFVFPNNKNIIMAANQAKDLSDRNVVVIPTKSIPQGIAALYNFDTQADVEANEKTMQGAVASVKSGLISTANKSTNVNGKAIEDGDILGIVDGEIEIVSKSVEQACSDMVAQFAGEGYSIVTLCYGEDVSEQQSKEMLEKLKSMGLDCEIGMHFGGQPLYYYIVSGEK